MVCLTCWVVLPSRITFCQKDTCYQSLCYAL
uniref:Uncharacterized protein n=1 Tax=Anguilla anguilla TaxID=7936 RepID=A0A0E9WI96_ANGAN